MHHNGTIHTISTETRALDAIARARALAHNLPRILAHFEDERTRFLVDYIMSSIVDELTEAEGVLSPTNGNQHLSEDGPSPRPLHSQIMNGSSYED